jgi:hypothetical protein
VSQQGFWWSTQAMAYQIIYKKRFIQKLFKFLAYLRSEWRKA